MTIAKVVMGYEQHGNSVRLVESQGVLTIIVQYKDKPARILGQFDRAAILPALNSYGEARDAMRLSA